MAIDTGASSAATVESIAVSDLLVACSKGASPEDRVARRVDPSTAKVRVRAPVRSLAMATRGLVQNALDASSEHVELAAAREPNGDLAIEVRDRGTGMSADVLARAGEPFFTTKPAGRGMGLGLFLARAVVEQLGGVLRVESTVGEGTRARLILPAKLQEALHEKLLEIEA